LHSTIPFVVSLSNHERIFSQLQGERGGFADSGCYSLIITLSQQKWIRIGKLGAARFSAGTYVYTGSAMKGLTARLRRHCRREKKLHWHIDHLLNMREARVNAIICYPAVPGQECRQNQRIARRSGATVILPRFGASDCRAGCASHLFFFQGRPSSRYRTIARDRRGLRLGCRPL
jgi:Uri superfamily endonuclease